MKYIAMLFTVLVAFTLLASVGSHKNEGKATSIETEITNTTINPDGSIKKQ